jgi:ribosomal protein S21
MANAIAVVRSGEPVDVALRALKKSLEREGAATAMRRDGFVPKSERRRTKSNRARKRQER